MAEVLNLADRRKDITRTKKPSVGDSGGFSFSDEVEKDITKLCDQLGVERDEAVHIATDFYRKYPMLMEHVRSPEHLLRGK